MRINRREVPMIAIICVVFAVLMILFLLGSCARPQPMGEDIWKGLAHMEKSRPPK